MKKAWAAILAMVLVLSLAAGCSSGNNESKATTSPKQSDAKQTTEPSPTVSDKEVTLKMSLWGDDNRKKTFEELAAKFTESHPNIKVEIMLIPQTEYQQKLSIMLASKTAPDVVWLFDTIIPQFRDAGQLLELSELVNDPAYEFSDIYPSTMDIFRKDDKLYGIPFSVGPKVLFYNKKLFEAKGLKTPNELFKEGNWTYEEMIKAAKAITDPSQGTYGVKLFYDWKNWKDAFTDTIWAYGADIFNEDGTQFVLNSPEGEAAFQMYYDMLFKDQVHPKPGDQISFESGKLGMYRNTFSYAANARKAEGLEFDIAPMPRGPVADAPVATGVAGYAVTKDTENRAEALELIKFFTGKEGMKMMQATFPPPRKSLLESAEFAQLNTQPSAEGIKLALSEPMSAGVRIQPSHKNWQQIDVKVQSLLDFMYTQSESVKSVLERMEKEVTPLMK